MGRILYGVMGDAGGHISQSIAIARQLRAHETIFVGGGRVNELARLGYSVIPVPMLGTKLSGHRVSATGTAAGAIRAISRGHTVVARLAALIQDWDPDLIITDYEYFLPRAARRLARNCISVDRQHALTLCHYSRPTGHQLSRALTLAIIRGMYSRASHYLVCSFLPLRPIDSGLAEVFSPVLREEVRAVRPTMGDHALVYLNGASAGWTRALLASRRRRFLIYGFDTAREEGNLIFRRNSVDEFLNDLGSCSYVICHGGHSLISEALHFGKPLLCYPVALLYEQWVNGQLVAEAGYGACHSPTGAMAALEAFESRLPHYRKRAAAYTTWRSETVTGRLEALILERGMPKPRREA